MHTLQFFATGLYEGAVASIFQTMLNGLFYDVSSHTYLDRLVLLSYFLLLNDLVLWV